MTTPTSDEGFDVLVINRGLKDPVTAPTVIGVVVRVPDDGADDADVNAARIACDHARGKIPQRRTRTLAVVVDDYDRIGAEQ